MEKTSQKKRNTSRKATKGPNLNSLASSSQNFQLTIPMKNKTPKREKTPTTKIEPEVGYNYTEPGYSVRVRETPGSAAEHSYFRDLKQVADYLKNKKVAPYSIDIVFCQELNVNLFY